MMTKQQEREALERIKNILADAGADSYRGGADFEQLEIRRTHRAGACPKPRRCCGG